MMLLWSIHLAVCHYTFVLVLNATPNEHGPICPIPHIHEIFLLQFQKRIDFTNALKAQPLKALQKANSSTHFCFLISVEILVFPVELLVF